MLPPSSAELEALLQQRFGLPAFRGLQAAVIERVLAGQDVLALMPTGAGKSLCYQLPALVLGGLTVVVSPLIALMRDQEQRLSALGIPALALTGRLERADRLRLSDRLADGSLRVLLVSPERVVVPGFLDGIRACVARPGVRLLVIDEAHCIAEWGHEFRPVYRRLHLLRGHFPQAPLLAMTASADARVQQLILEVLAMPPDAVLRSSFDRPELFYRVAGSPAPWRHALAYLQHHHPAACAILYCRRRWETVALAHFLGGHGVPTRPYHAGLPAAVRSAAEHWFKDQPGAVMAATIAFGMGIDKADVRLVIHLGLARSLAAYYQESGRAGRDGLPADALTLLDESGGPAVAGSDPALIDWVEDGACRRVGLLAGFGEVYQGPCGQCDRCRPDYHPVPVLPAHSLLWVPRRARGVGPR